MKKNFVAPTCELIILQDEDMITTSSPYDMNDYAQQDEIDDIPVVGFGIDG